VSAAQAYLAQINALLCGVFVLTAFGMIIVRQVGACLTLFIAQSALLATSAFLLGSVPFSWHLFAVGCVTLLSKPVLIPWLLRRLVPREVYTVREISQALDAPAALLVALGLALIGVAVGARLVAAAPLAAPQNVVVGFASLLIAALVLAVRREAVPQILGILAMENAAFLAGIAVAPNFPLIAELAIAFDVPLLAFIVAVLTRAVYRSVGSTAVGELTSLREMTE
jgi:hydrogenase-4 component E